MYRDQIAAVYQNYKVLRTKFTWRASTSNTNNGILTVMAYQTTPPTVLGEIVEFSRRPPQHLTQYQQVSGSVAIDIATALGLRQDEYIRNSYYNTPVGTNSSPTVWVQFLLEKATATDTGCSLSVFVEMDALYMTPLDPGQS